MPTRPPAERAAMAHRVAASRVSSVLSGVGRGQRAGMAVPSAATIPARTSGGRLAHAATRRARSASGGAWLPPAIGRAVGGTAPRVGSPVRSRPAPRFGPGAASAAPGAARSSESAYSPGDSASARGFDSPRLHSSETPGLAETSRELQSMHGLAADICASARGRATPLRLPSMLSLPAPFNACSGSGSDAGTARGPRAEFHEARRSPSLLTGSASGCRNTPSLPPDHPAAPVTLRWRAPRRAANPAVCRSRRPAIRRLLRVLADPLKILPPSPPFPPQCRALLLARPKIRAIVPPAGGLPFGPSPRHPGRSLSRSEQPDRLHP